jgi:imidazole glycerol-phosphate synthase subunit HisH
MIGILDYGVGNINVIQRRFLELNYTTMRLNSPDMVKKASSLVLPGVGDFKNAMDKFIAKGFSEVVPHAVEQGVPILGICVGHQMLFDSSNEGPTRTEGLGLLTGSVDKLSSNEELTLPHMGWNKFIDVKTHDITKGISTDDEIYYLHSYYATTNMKNIIATTYYGSKFCSIAGRDNIIGIQGHPEKSHFTGLKLLDNFGKFYAA